MFQIRLINVYMSIYVRNITSVVKYIVSESPNLIRRNLNKKYGLKDQCTASVNVKFSKKGKTH